MTIYQHACIITVNDSFDVIEDGTLVTEGTRISYVGPHKDFEDGRVIDCRGKAIMPGFVNGHCHLPMTFFRGFSDDLNLQDWLNNVIFPLEAKHTDESMYYGTLLSALEMTRTGTTTVNCMDYSGEVDSRVLKEAGLSGIINTCLIGVSGQSDSQMARTLALTEKFKNDEQIRVSIGPHAEYTATLELLENWAKKAIEHQLPIHIHCSETAAEHNGCIERYGMTPVELFHKIGMTQVPLFLAHCVWLSDHDMEILKQNNSTVLHNPISNLKLGSGIARVPELMRRGVNIALATDGPASNNTLDMWEEMRVAALIHKGNNLDPLAVNVQEALYMATRGGALALGYTDRGTLQAGSRADFIVIDLDQPSMHPMTDLQHLIVYSGNSRDIVMTVAGGEILYDHGTYTKLDKEKIYAECQKDFHEVYGG